MAEPLRIGNVAVGGELGENPTLLIGSIFYQGDKLLRSPAGDFDRGKAWEVVENAAALAGEYGLQFALDVIFPTVESVEKILPFVAEFDTVLFLDSPEPGARIRSYALAKELGVESRVVANGIDPYTSDEELNVIKENGVKAAVLLVFDPKKPASLKPEDRVEIAVKQLLPKARKAELQVPLLDAVVIDPGSIILSAVAVKMLREQLKLPAGCAPANALGAASRKRMGDEALAVHSAVATLLRVYGADFIFYGPVKRIDLVAPALAMVDGLLGYLLRTKGVKLGGKHPVRTLLRKVQQLFVERG